MRKHVYQVLVLSGSSGEPGRCRCTSRLLVNMCSSDLNHVHDADEDGICDDVDDCVGVEYDECGECGGDGIADGECVCDGNTLDCSDVCGGAAEYDDCGVCNGDGTGCETTYIEIGYDSASNIAGFQFNMYQVSDVSWRHQVVRLKMQALLYSVGCSD